MTIWERAKESVIRAGLEPWLRPIVEAMRGQDLEDDELYGLALIARLKPDAVCVDIGCNKGKVLDPMRQAAPGGRFFAFEPIPHLYRLLEAKYRSDPRVRLFNVALSASNGSAPFFVNQTDFGLSGLSSRPGRVEQAGLTRIEVPVRTLDSVLGKHHVDFIKIDVEGAEFDVLVGARAILAASHPLILFEFGLGGADYFGVDAETMYGLFAELNYNLYSIDEFLRGRRALPLDVFRSHFERNSKYNFVAAWATEPVHKP